MTAHDMPNRRLAITQSVTWNDSDFLLGVGFALDGTVREIFLQGVKSGSDLECLMDDACILASKQMQAGASAADLAAALDGPASLLSVVLQTAADIEATGKVAAVEVYRAAGLI